MSEPPPRPLGARSALVTGPAPPPFDGHECDFFVSVPAQLRVSPRVCGRRAAGLTEIGGTVVSLSTSGRGRFLHRGLPTWWAQLRVPSELHAKGIQASVSIESTITNDDHLHVVFDGGVALFGELLPLLGGLDEQIALLRDLQRLDGAAAAAAGRTEPSATQASSKF